ncbi:hypothetical protein [Bryobacter aggregatus]|uniref:hypothetical protein n=1 Tax=Bryobacter aggregatus TaxID=360054 RepID=UPI0004E14861|nr:hypothetical protein [Bryobacter aggregatus]
MQEQHRQLEQLRKEVNEGNYWAIHLDQQVKTLTARVAELQDEVQEKISWAEAVRKDLSERDAQLRQLQTEFADRSH